MIRHISIPANDPQRVARVLAELWRSEARAFPGLDGAYWAGPGDGHGTMIDVYPCTTQIVPGAAGEPCDFREGPKATLGGWHALISVAASDDEVVAIAAREGWRATPVKRQNGAFALIELWIEGATLIEVLTPSMQADYERFMDPKNAEGFFRSGA